MNYSENYKLNKPQRNEQFNLDHWNENTDKIDSVMNTNRTNIADNASNISTILTGLSTINTSDRDSVYYKLMKLIYPVGSIYWSSKNTNPGTLFGGTWTQIKDKFVLACGDTYKTTGATGGASTVTLSISNMPTHNHTFTPVGNVSSHAHGLASHTHSFTPAGTISAHSHGLASHTHSFTPAGTISAHSHTLNSGNTSSSGSKTTAGFRGIAHKHDVMAGTEYITYYSNKGYGIKSNHTIIEGNYTSETGYIQTHESWASGYLYGSTDSSTPRFTGTAGTTGSATGYTDSSTPRFTGTAGTTGSATGYTDSSTPTFTGVRDTTSSNGSGTSFSIMPPYIVKYCWERTA